MTTIRVNRKLGPLAMAIFLILFGLRYLLKLNFEGIDAMMGICALIAGILGLLDIEP
jgi:hypothetical protein